MDNASIDASAGEYRWSSARIDGREQATTWQRVGTNIGACDRETIDTRDRPNTGARDGIDAARERARDCEPRPRPRTRAAGLIVLSSSRHATA